MVITQVSIHQLLLSGSIALFDSFSIFVESTSSHGLSFRSGLEMSAERGKSFVQTCIVRRNYVNFFISLPEHFPSISDV